MFVSDSLYHLFVCLFIQDGSSHMELGKNSLNRASCTCTNKLYFCDFSHDFLVIFDAGDVCTQWTEQGDSEQHGRKPKKESSCATMPYLTDNRFAASRATWHCWIKKEIHVA